jgi:hypothetical protein
MPDVRHLAFRDPKPGDVNDVARFIGADASSAVRLSTVA